MSKQRITYRISGIDDIVHRFSPEGYELLSDGFTAQLERRLPSIPGDKDIEIMLKGCRLTEAEGAAVARAYRSRYRLQLSDTENRLKRAAIRILWFLVSMLASSILLSFVRPDTEEWTVFLLYMPIWFFGYRLFTYSILDLPALWRERRRITQLLRAQLCFEVEGAPGSVGMALDDTDGKDFVREYFMEGSTLLPECVAARPEALLCEDCAEGDELITEELATYLEQVVPFVRPGLSVRLTVDGARLREGDPERLRRGVSNHFALRIAETDGQIGENRRQILVFAIGLLIIGLILCTVGRRLDTGYHEIVLILLWFFGDYLVEFILLSPWSLYRRRDSLRRMRDMEILVKPHAGDTE